MELEFVKASAADAAALIAVQNRAYHDDFVMLGACPGYGWDERTMQRCLADADAYMVFCDGVLAGDVIISRMSDKEYHLHSICVTPEYRGKGLGERIIGFVDSTYPDAQFWTLEMPMGKSRNSAFFAKLGFEIADRMKDGGVEIVVLKRRCRVPETLYCS